MTTDFYLPIVDTHGAEETPLQWLLFRERTSEVYWKGLVLALVDLHFMMPQQILRYFYPRFSI